MKFDIPVVLFIFKREKAVRIVERIRAVAPRKVYILADQGRNEAEIIKAEACRKAIEQAIDWECEIIKNYAEENRGVYQNIGEGAKWVLRQEKWAIFLEDDNLPEVTFFEFCREMLQRYEHDQRILWICGTNYLGEYKPADGMSYVFTRHMLPCGWASWSDKFERFYDGELKLCDDPGVMSKIGEVYCNKKVFRQYRASWMKEYQRIQQNERPKSWDYQMDFSIKANNLFGICPCRNQIKNIGIDEDSIHGGNSFDSVMTRRFCGMNSYPIEFPLKHPETLLMDPVFEKKIGKIILYPLSMRVRRALGTGLKRIIGLEEDQSIRAFLKKV